MSGCCHMNPDTYCLSCASEKAERFRSERNALRKRVEELEQELSSGHNVGCNEALSEAQARADKAERERDEALAAFRLQRGLINDKLQAELDAARADAARCGRAEPAAMTDADSLRTKLKALVEDGRRTAGAYKMSAQVTDICYGNGILSVLGQLAALLAESETQFGAGTTSAYGGMSSGGRQAGCGRDHGGGSWNANCPDCEAKAKLPLGHEYNDYGCKVRPCRGLCHVHGCGQPRSAHEPK